ncbi:hypothetical protein P4T90_10875 [Heyndrickxia acidicola]|uniref:Uncharacterized protein n=1 Tax=Heyndrickxia acidicola TaxID=209389 RepID=A0ABU6MFV7_9BACI|nr:hypothetical protein [Heyndrickxia acidicola]MED1203575.1 hypothetical protein [Heyndrickxia acidicola]
MAEYNIAHGKMLFTNFSGIIPFDRDLTSEWTKEGLKLPGNEGNILEDEKR